MRYYCKNCKSEILNDITGVSGCICACCGESNFLTELPDYESVKQWEKRTGEKYPNNGLVWYKPTRFLETKKNCWKGSVYKREADDVIDWKVVVANPPIPPSDDWEPEE